MVNLREKREVKGFTQEKLAEKVFCTKNAISNYENGIRRPSVEMAKAIASVLEFAWTEFYE